MVRHGYSGFVVRNIGGSLLNEGCWTVGFCVLVETISGEVGFWICLVESMSVADWSFGQKRYKIHQIGIPRQWVQEM